MHAFVHNFTFHRYSSFEDRHRCGTEGRSGGRVQSRASQGACQNFMVNSLNSSSDYLRFS